MCMQSVSSSQITNERIAGWNDFQKWLALGVLEFERLVSKFLSEFRKKNDVTHTQQTELERSTGKTAKSMTPTKDYERERIDA